MGQQAHQVECEVAVNPEEVFGVFANAFRVLEGDNGVCLMEFLIYSSTEQRAIVVKRVPVKQSFLPVILDQINNRLRPLEQVVVPSTT